MKKNQATLLEASDIKVLFQYREQKIERITNISAK